MRRVADSIAATFSAVGYNPFRARVKRTSDIYIVAAALLVIAGLVAWALFGG